MFASFGNSIKGREQLWKAFWLWGINGNIISISLFFLITHFFRKDEEYAFLAPLYFAIAQIFYYVISMVMIWKCSPNVGLGRKTISYLSRMFVVLSPSIFILIFSLEYYILLNANWK